MEQLQVFEQNGELYTDSRDVAANTGKEHKHLIRDIENYTRVILQSPNLDLANYFIESSYIGLNNRPNKHFLLTRIGCDMVANKMTGDKGILFTAMYVDQFEKMKTHIESQQRKIPTNDFEALEMMFRIQKENREEVKQIKKDVHNIREIVSLETKEEPPNKAVIEIDEERYVFEYEYVENLVERVLAVKSGEEEAESCGRCSYCRKSKKLTDTIEVAELIN